jgi:Uma2 family endonuclease
MTVEEFDQFAALAQNGDQQLEYVGGEIIETVSNQRLASIVYYLGVNSGMYLLQHNLGGAATGGMVAT